MAEAGPTRDNTAQATGPDNLRGILWILGSVVASSAMSVAVRDISLSIDTRMIVLLRSGISLALLIMAAVVVARLRDQLRFSQPGLHIIRGSLIAISTHLGFYTLANLPLATATVLFFTAPIFATLLAGPVHGEQVGPRRWAAVAAGFVGALIILRPGFGTLEPAMLAALGSSAFFALALTLSRNLAQADGPVAAYFSSVVITVILSLPVALPVLALPQTGWAWVVVGILVITGAVRGYADIEAYRYGEASVIAPITYLRLVLVGAAGYVLFDETIDRPTVIGAIIIVGATLYIAQRERQRVKKTSGPVAPPR